MPRTATNLPTPYDEDEKPAPAVGITTAVIIASVLVLLAVACFVGMNVLGIGLGSHPTTSAVHQIAVPSLVGKSLDDANSAATGAGLVLTVTYQPVTDPTQYNKVILQKPAPPAQVAVGASIDVTVGQSANTATLPNVIGQRSSDAISLLKNKGFTASVGSIVANSQYQPGYVIDMSPEAGPAVALSTPIVLTVSGGPAPATAAPTSAATATAGATAPPTTGVTPTPTPTKAATDTPTPASTKTPGP